jgi:hypothetical protein
MSNSQSADKFHLGHLLLTILHTNILLQRALDTITRHLLGDAPPHPPDIMYVNMSGNEVTQETMEVNAHPTETGNGTIGIIEVWNTDAVVPNITVPHATEAHTTNADVHLDI